MPTRRHFNFDPLSPVEQNHSVISAADERKALLAEWLEQDTPFSGGSLEIASADASFRRYFRIQSGGHNFIVMDAPPGLEDSHPFVKIGEWMKSQDIQVPEIFAKDLSKGLSLIHI